jgi:hypothetical protein
LYGKEKDSNGVKAQHQLQKWHLKKNFFDFQKLINWVFQMFLSFVINQKWDSNHKEKNHLVIWT